MTTSPAIETIELQGECTRLHIVHERDGEPPFVWFVWLDDDVHVKQGVAIGLGTTRAEAIADAITELRTRVQDLEGAMEREE